MLLLVSCCVVWVPVGLTDRRPKQLLAAAIGISLTKKEGLGKQHAAVILHARLPDQSK